MCASSAVELTIVFQPKYETRESRDRLESFIMALYHERPEAFARFVRERFDCSYLLVDLKILKNWRYMAGLPPGAPTQVSETAAAALLRHARQSPVPIPGFELLYTTPTPRHPLRLYRIRAGGEIRSGSAQRTTLPFRAR